MHKKCHAVCGTVDELHTEALALPELREPELYTTHSPEGEGEGEGGGEGGCRQWGTSCHVPRHKPEDALKREKGWQVLLRNTELCLALKQVLQPSRNKSESLT